MANSYHVGDKPRIRGVLADSDGDSADPTLAMCDIRSPSGTITTLVYGTDPELAKETTGVYYADVAVDAPGVWYYRFYSTGTGQAAAEGYFEVRGSEFD